MKNKSENSEECISIFPDKITTEQDTFILWLLTCLGHTLLSSRISRKFQDNPIITPELTQAKHNMMYK